MTTGYVAANGIRIFYVEEGEGPLVLLCHGFPELSYSWRNQMAPLAEAGFRAVAIDLPGYGRSDKPDVTYDVEWLCECLAGVIGGLGAERAVVVGHDWGGLLAWPLARLHPEKVAGVIGVNTPDTPLPPVPPTEYFRRQGSNKHSYILEFQKRDEPEAFFEADTKAALELFFKGPVTTHPEVFTDEVMQVYVDAFSAKGAMTPPLEYYRNIDRNWELMAYPDLQQIEVRVLDDQRSERLRSSSGAHEEHGGACAQPHEGCHRRLRALDATGATRSHYRAHARLPEEARALVLGLGAEESVAEVA